MTARRPEAIPGSPSALRQVGLGVGLTVAWCALWGEASVANAVSGLLVAAGVLAVGQLGDPTGVRTRGGVRLRPLVRLMALIASDLVVSTLTVAWEVLTPTDHTEEVIIAVEIPEMARHHLLVLVVGVTVTPGTAVVDVDLGIDGDGDRGRPTLHLHLLHRDRAPAVAARVRQMADLAADALPTSGSTPTSPTPGTSLR